MKKPLFCPECDSDKIRVDWETDQISLPGGDKFDYEKEIHICENCGERGVFSRSIIKENHERYLAALQENNNRSLESITDYLSQHNLKMAFVERSLRLPQRTVSRWKSKGVSASGMALMRIIKTFPWILCVAEKDFDERFSKEELVRQAFPIIQETIRNPDEINSVNTSQNKHLKAAWFTPQGAFTITASLVVDREIIAMENPNAMPKRTIAGEMPHATEIEFEILEGDVKI